jgi:phosphoadenosine phosphosulfate reductase
MNFILQSAGPEEAIGLRNIEHKYMDMDLEALNRKYSPLTPEQRIAALYTDFSEVLYTSSFGTTAVYLLHLFSKIHPAQKVHFLDTTYHFPETLAYKEQLSKEFQLTVETLKGDEWRNKFTREDQTWSKDPDLCCSVNKVEPLEKIKSQFQVWVSGLIGTQNEHRHELKIFEERHGIIKFYPILDQSEEQVNAYILQHNLPRHPLQEKGYNSVGCTHCTVQGKAREGRWLNKSKTECGLHL